VPGSRIEREHRDASSRSTIRRPARIGLLEVALVLALSLFILAAAPQAQAATLGLDGDRVTLGLTALGAIDASFGTALPDEVKLGTANVPARLAQAH
jgi:hypothetical protein